MLTRSISRQSRLSPRQQHGVGLIELMIALVIGLAVSGAIIAFVAATLQNNAVTIQSTRLNQELRALTELVVRDLRRARAMQDPFANIGSSCSSNPTATNACANLALLQSVDSPSAGCVIYAYQGASGGDFRSLRREVNGGVGRIVLARGTAAQTCTSAGTVLSSPNINVTAFDVTEVGNNQLNIEIAGSVVGVAGSVEQRYRASVHIRSGGVGV